jgi:hypothetical protein
MNRNCVGDFLTGTENGDKVMGINILFLILIELCVCHTS